MHPPERAFHTQDAPRDAQRAIAHVLALLGAAGLGVPLVEARAPASSARVDGTRVDATWPGANPPRSTLGDITLLTHQRSAVARLQRTLPRYGGALLADDVGLGKTYVALAVARDYTAVSVIAPAALRGTWRAAIARASAEVAHVRLHSLQAFSRRAPARATDAPDVPRAAARLVIIDEAHHLRNPATRRYAVVADWCRGAHVLLLSATPVHNHERDLDHLLALFLGRAVHGLDAADRLRLVVRRRVEDADLDVPAPRVHVLPSRRIPDVPDVTTAIVALPAPLPTRDGRAASALIALGLLRAWCSSAGACAALVQRRRLRAEALADALAEGRWPTRRELQSWSVGDDAVQLGFSALLVADTVGPAHATEPLAHARSWRGSLSDARRALHRHAEALERLWRRVREVAETSDRARVDAVRAVRAEWRGHTALAFTQFAGTVHALGRLMRWDDGVATLTARGGRVAGGPLSRAELLARVAPHAHGRAEPPPHERIRLLITTDLLAEGVNLQDASVVIHLDQPWTPAALAQREGRVARLGSRHRDVYVCTIEPPGGAAGMLAIADRLRRKARAADRSLRPEAAPHRTEPAPSGSPALSTRLHAWCLATEVADEARSVARATPPPRDAAPPSASSTTLVLRGTRPFTTPPVRAGWLAALARGDDTRLYGGWCRGPSLRTVASRDPRVLQALVLAVEDARTRCPPTFVHDAPAAGVDDRPGVTHPAVADDAAPSAARVCDTVHRALRRTLSQWQAHALVTTLDGATVRAQRALRGLLATATLSERVALTADVRRAAERLPALRGIGDERALDELLRHVGRPDPRAWLAELHALLAHGGAQSVEPPAPTVVRAECMPHGLLALLIVLP